MIVVRIWDGLGNQLFQYAYALSLKKRGYDVYLDLNKGFDDKFEKFKNFDVREIQLVNFNISLPHIDITKNQNFDFINQLNGKIDNRCIEHINDNGEHYYFYEENKQFYTHDAFELSDNTYVKGWFQSENYFKNCISEVLKDCSLKKEPKISEHLKEIVGNPNSCAIHIRRGDYVKLNHALNKYYYKKALMYIKYKINNPIFLVFTDNVEWVKRNLDIDSNVYFIKDYGCYSDYEELYIMSLCKNNIISNSTFSWWGAWLNKNEDKIVATPNEKTWFPDQRGIIPEDWVCIR